MQVINAMSLKGLRLLSSYYNIW